MTKLGSAIGFAALGLLVSGSTMAKAPQWLEPQSFPRIGTCYATRLYSIGPRLSVGREAAAFRRDDDDAGALALFADGHHMVSYHNARVVHSWRRGDPMRLCVTALPDDCPPGDYGGVIYLAHDLRNHTRWEAMETIHSCGGA